MTKRIKTNVKGFEKDQKTAAVINTDDNYTRFLQEKKKVLENNNLKKDVDCLRNEIRELKSLILSLKGI